MRFALSLLLLCSTLTATNFEPNLENSNIIGYQKDAGTVDYNRLRLTLDLYHDKLSSKFIIDNENVYQFKPKENENQSKLYRGYLRYSDEKHMLTLGLQRIPLGVGRIWNPIDIFNPIEITSIETDERKGTRALRYEYAMSALSNLDFTLSKNRQAIRLKGYLEVADVAVIMLKKDDAEVFGFEIEGELHEITLRSEGGYFSDTDSFRCILGAEYGFENSFTILTELYHDNKADEKKAALQLSYQYSPLLYLNLLTLREFHHDTNLIAPSLSYSLSDESTLQMGAFIPNKSQNRFYLHYFIHF